MCNVWWHILAFPFYSVIQLGWIQSGVYKLVIFGSFPDVFHFFWPFRAGAHLLWYSWATGKGKKLENATLKKVKFQDLLILAYFLIFNIFDFLSITSIKTIQKRKCLGCFEKFRKFAARWAQEFSKLMEKCLR